MSVQNVESMAAKARDPGHPRSLWFLAFSEAWERFSFYGMQTLLVLYMANHLLLDDRQEEVVGFGAFRAAIETITGSLSLVALASLIFGLYSSTVYLTPIMGGAIADRLLGRTRTIVIGALVMVMGHFLMAFEFSFLIALAAIAIGTGLFKGNIASQVGSLYSEGDPARSRAFQIFYLGISLGAIGAPLICGTLGELYGWHWGFGAAGVGMLLGLAIYLLGRRHLPAAEIRSPKATRAPMSADDRRRVMRALVLLPVLAILVVPNQQIFNAYLLWAQDAYDFQIAGQTVPTTWLISIDAAASVALLAGSVAFWRWWGSRFTEPDDTYKIAGAGLVTAGAFGMLAGLAGFSEPGQLSLGWAVAFHCLNNLAFANMVPVGLSLFTRMSPASFGATAVGVYYLHLFVANNIVGWLGGYLDKMPISQFWLMHAGIAVVGTILVLLAGMMFRSPREA